MEQIEITNDAPPMIRSKTINIEGADYKYTIKKDEKGKEIIIQLSEAKPDKYITFMYRSSTEKIVKTIKVLFACENIDEMIISLHDIFINGNDLKNLGIEPSQKYQECFDYILCKKFENLKLTKDDEIKLAKKFFQK